MAEPVVVPDSSAALAALLRGGRAARRLGGTDLVVPHAVDADVADGLARLLDRGRVSPGLAEAALDTWRRLVLDRVGHAPLLPRAWQLRGALATGPALCVALAEVLDVTLVTCDARMAAVPGLRATVELVPA